MYTLYPIYCEKERKKGKTNQPKLEPATQNLTLLLRPCQCGPFSTVGSIGVSGLLPLSLEVVSTGISRLTMGALLVWRWAAGGRQKTRAVGRFEDLVPREDLVFLDGSSR